MGEENGHEEAAPPAQAPAEELPAVPESPLAKLGKWAKRQKLTQEQLAVAREEAGYKTVAWKDLTAKQAEEIMVKARGMIPPSPAEAAPTAPQASDEAPWPEEE